MFLFKGNAFAFSKKGHFSITMNSLFPMKTTTTGAGQYFVLRDLLDSHSMDDAISRATKYQIDKNLKKKSRLNE